MKKLILGISILLISCQRIDQPIEKIREEGRSTELSQIKQEINYNSEKGCIEYLIMFKDNVDSLKENGYKLSTNDSTNVYNVCWN